MVSIKNNQLYILPDSTSLFKTIADDFMQRVIKSVKDKGIFTVVLAGGNTPKKLFSLLATEPYKSSIPWDKIYFFFGDERYVPEDQPNNNFFMAHQYLFNHVSVPMVNVFGIPTEYENPAEAAEDYADTLRSVMKVAADQVPQFDLIYLGLGSNAHTASLMPYTDLVKAYANSVDGNDKDQIVAATWVEELGMYRITLTPPVLNNAGSIIFLLEGAEKAEAVWQILQGPYDPVIYPAQLIKSTQPLIWFLDQSAASQLKLQG